MSFHFGKAVKFAACEQDWITPKHYAHCLVHVARRIWMQIQGDREQWMGSPSDWTSLPTETDTHERGSRAFKVAKALHDNTRAVNVANDIVRRYDGKASVERNVGEQIHMIHHRYRWIDAKRPGFYPAEVREAFYAILDAKEIRAAYEYLRTLSGDGGGVLAELHH